MIDEPAPHAFGRVDNERIRFAQREETQHVVEIAVGQDDGGDR